MISFTLTYKSSFTFTLFHFIRHTFATLQIAGGTDLYTVSKMLGHTNVRTTQIYAKVVDKLKDEAANAISLDLNTDDID